MVNGCYVPGCTREGSHPTTLRGGKVLVCEKHLEKYREAYAAALKRWQDGADAYELQRARNEARDRFDRRRGRR